MLCYQDLSTGRVWGLMKAYHCHILGIAVAYARACMLARSWTQADSRYHLTCMSTSRATGESVMVSEICTYYIVSSGHASGRPLVERRIHWLVPGLRTSLHQGCPSSAMQLAIY
jgi:hypothetical protein